MNRRSPRVHLGKILSLLGVLALPALSGENPSLPTLLRLNNNQNWKSRLTAYIAAILLLTSLAAHAAENFRVGGLQCEMQENPAGIDVEHPAFHWLMESPRDGERQTACRILVTTNRLQLDATTADCWDSGKVASDASIAVAAPAALARRLQVSTGEPLLLRRHTVFDKGKRPLEFAEVHYVSSRFALTLDLKREPPGF